MAENTTLIDLHLEMFRGSIISTCIKCDSFIYGRGLTRKSHPTNARLGGQSDRHVSGVAGMLAGGASRRAEYWNLLRCRRSEESVSVGLGMTPREYRDAAARVRRASRGRLRRRADGRPDPRYQRRDRQMPSPF